MTFYDIIYNWVKDNFGQSEADEPSWNIEALAKHLSESDINPEELNAYTKNNVYGELREHYLDEDIAQIATDKSIELTPEDMMYIKHQYYKMDDETWEQLSCIIDTLMMEKRG